MLVYVNDRSLINKPQRVKKERVASATRVVNQDAAKRLISDHPDRFTGMDEATSINFAFELLLEPAA